MQDFSPKCISLALTNNGNENYLPIGLTQRIIHNVYMYIVIVLSRIILTFDIMNKSLNTLRVGMSAVAGR